MLLHGNECNEDSIWQTKIKFIANKYKTTQQDKCHSMDGRLDLYAINKSPKFQVFPIYLCPYNTPGQARINKENIFIKKCKPYLNKHIYQGLI